MKNPFNIRRTASLALLVLTPFLLQAREVSKSLGNLKSVNKTSEAVTITADGGYLKITPWNDNIIRIQISSDNTFDDFSYTVISQPEVSSFKYADNSGYLKIESGNIILIVNKKPLGLQFTDKDGNLLNEDDTGGGIRSFEGTWYVHKKTLPGERFIGLGEKTGPLDKAGHSYTNWNSDVPGYPANQDPLYQTLPFYMGIHDSQVYGIYLDNSYRSNFCFGRTPQTPTFFGVNGGDMDYFFMAGKTVADVVKIYASLTGTIKLPPLWSLGLHQSRYSYYPESEVMDIARIYREKKIPADVITLDIDYMDHYKIFTWNKTYFPDPPEMISKLKDMGFHTTVILDPGIKIEKGYPVYDDGLARNVFIKNPGGDTYFRGEVWPGMCYFPDFTNPATRQWWGDHLKKLADEGVRGFWNDMNEPALWTKMFDPYSLNNFDGHPSTHLRAHNVYGMQMARSSYEGAV
ncbi:MAG TPA: TIM-barrel domain-containing protein, partial [Bacteroidales bacterium]|nr:TIM-barrel domain-containing protein [Bacteroidales bacterium]